MLARLAQLIASAFMALYALVAAALVAPLHLHERCYPRTEEGAIAEDTRPVVSFGGCGFLYPYQLGAAAYIAEAFDTSALRCAGHSAGFASALTLAAGVPADVHWAVLLAARSRWSTRLLGPFLDGTRHWMAPYLCGLAPYEAAILQAAVDGRLALGYTRLVASPRGLRAGHAVAARFRSLREFVYCVTVSQRCMPFYRSPGALDGGWGLDGAFSAQFTLPPRGAPSRCLTVSPTNPLADVAPHPPLPPHWFLTLPDAARWAALREVRARNAFGGETAILRGVHALTAASSRPVARRGATGTRGRRTRRCSSAG